jgi:acyl carrier protein
MTKIQFIARFATEIGTGASGVTEQSLLREIANWDSMNQLATLALLDECFGENVSPTDLARCETVGDMLRLVEAKIHS